MNKTFKRVLTIALALTLCLSLAAPAFADEGGGTETKKTAVTVYSNLVVDAAVPVPATTVKITVSGGPKQENATDNVDRYAGIEAGVKVGPNGGLSDTIDFTASDVTLTGGVAGEGQKYASHGLSIDFTNVKWTAPGLYRYTVKQTCDNPVAGVTYDDTVYYVDVFVQWKNGDGGEDDVLEPGGVTVTPEDEDPPTGKGNGSDDDDNGDGEVDPDPDDPDNKKEPDEGEYNGGTDGAFNFVNTYGQSEYITLTKEVLGKQGDRNKEFKFTVTLSGTPGTYYITGDWTDGENTENSTTTITVPADGNASATVYLKDGDVVKIVAANGVKYTIVENDAADYKTAIGEAPEKWDADDFTDDKDTDGTIATDTPVDVKFINYKTGEITDTGVLLTIAPFVILMIVGIIGATVVMTKKKYE